MKNDSRVVTESGGLISPTCAGYRRVTTLFFCPSHAFGDPGCAYAHTGWPPPAGALLSEIDHSIRRATLHPRDGQSWTDSKTADGYEKRAHVLKILVILALFVVWDPAVLAQRAISSREQASRLQSRERVIYSPDCGGDVPRISLEVTIDQYGAVTRVKERKARWVSIRLPVTAVRSLVKRAKKMVATWRYEPTLVARKPIAVKTVVTVPCVAPPK